jgi:hypothetical protein
MLNSKLSKVLPGVIPVALSLLVLTSGAALSEESAQASQPSSNPKIALAGSTDKPAVENPKANSDTEYTTKQNRDLKKALSTYVGDMVISAY